MNYREKGQLFCNEINGLLSDNNIKAAFVTGGGYAYDSIKYADSKNKGDFDFMIVYDNDESIDRILELLKTTNFDFEKKYLNLDKKLLFDNKIDIIRLSGKYMDVKGTINLVPKKIVESICNFKNDLIIRKIAHNRNTSLFFAYGSDNSRIITNFISPSFVTEDMEDHYVHLDFSYALKNNNIYLGILADAVLKGFNKNYDTIGFKDMRNNFIRNIHDFYEKNEINSSNYIGLFSNNNYFPEYLKLQLLEEFNTFGIIDGVDKKYKNLEPIIFTIDFDIDYERKPFNFINNKSLKCNFRNYIDMMQNNEYDRQYLLDALGKFFGYLSSENLGNKNYNGSILDKIIVYGVNDLYLPNVEEYNMTSIIEAIINDINSQSNTLNNELVRNYLIICTKFLEKISNMSSIEIINNTKVDSSIFNIEALPIMDINIINKLTSFNEIGTYHNYCSKVMPKYTINEAKFLEDVFLNKDAKVLDIMCGYGRLTNQLVKDGYTDVTGIDNEKYGFLGVPKDFIFIHNEFLNYNFDQKYDYAYSLYNCYYNLENLIVNFEKTYGILNKDGILIADFFNKMWRDSINPNFYKELYSDDRYKLIVKRSYDKNSGEELTVYELYYLNNVINSWSFSQKFFELDSVINALDKTLWNYELYNSSNLTTRTNDQKNIMILRRK